MRALAGVVMVHLGCAGVYQAGVTAQFPCVALCEDAVEGLCGARRVSESECRCTALNPWRFNQADAGVDLLFWRIGETPPRWVPRALDARGRSAGVVQYQGELLGYRYAVPWGAR